MSVRLKKLRDRNRVDRPSRALTANHYEGFGSRSCQRDNLMPGVRRSHAHA